MKKIIVSLFCTLFISMALFAQTTIKPAIGFNLSDFSKDANGEAKGRAGYQIGGSIAFGKKLYVEPGIFYLRKSTEYSSTSTTISNFNADISGIRVPVAVGLNLLGNEKTLASLRAFGGPSAFFITDVNDELDKDQLNTTHFGLFAGAGIDIWKLFLDVSYEWSLTNLQKDVTQIDIGKSRSLFVNAGIRINL